MNIVSVINYKGGVGKTTVTANLAGFLATRGKKILLLDMDAQASLTFSFITPDYWQQHLESNKTIKQWFDDIINGKESQPIEDIIIKPEVVNHHLSDTLQMQGKIGLIASHLDLINIDLELATLLRGANMTQAKKNYVNVHGNLRKTLLEISEDQYDLVLIDCPPNFNIVTKNALLASDRIFIPAKADYLSTLGISYLQRNVKTLIKEYNEYVENLDEEETVDPSILGVLFTMVREYGGGPIQAQSQYIEQTKRQNIPVFDSYTLENATLYARAPEECIPVILKHPANPTQDNNISQLEHIGAEFICKMELE